MMRKPLGAFAVCLLLAACGGGGTDGVISGGPLRYPEGASETWAVVAKQGDRFTDGSSVLDLGGHQPIRVISVESVGGSQSLRFLGARLVSPHRKFTDFLRADDWPPSNLPARKLYGIHDVVVTPNRSNFHHEPYQLVLGYEVISSEFAVRRGVRVRYEAGGKTYEVMMRNQIAACPPGMDQRVCMDRAGDGL